MPTRKNLPNLLFFSPLLFNLSCENTVDNQRADELFLVNDQQQYLYDLKKPDKKYYLPYALEEVSGLTLTDEGHILAVDDESGKIFEYDLQEKRIIHSIEFYKPGDFEGIEIVANKIYVLRSDGDLFVFDYTEEKEVRPKVIESKLSVKNDAEGLGYDPGSHSLIVACKEQGGIGEENVDGRAFYRFLLKEERLSEQATFTIGPKQLEKFWESLREFDYDLRRIKFKPSAIAFHPIEKNFYVLSSVGKLVVVITAEGAIKATYPIPPRVLSQPEGICFDKEGSLFISSEGEGDRGYILKFKMKKKQ